MVKWTITMDGHEIGLKGDWSLEFLNAEDYINGKVLTKDFLKHYLKIFKNMTIIIGEVSLRV